MQIPDGPKMARAALHRRAIDGPFAVMKQKSGATPVSCFAVIRATYGCTDPLQTGHLDGPKMARLK